MKQTNASVRKGFRLFQYQSKRFLNTKSCLPMKFHFLFPLKVVGKMIEIASEEKFNDVRAFEYEISQNNDCEIDNWLNRQVSRSSRCDHGLTGSDVFGSLFTVHVWAQESVCNAPGIFWHASLPSKQSNVHKIDSIAESINLGREEKENPS